MSTMLPDDLRVIWYRPITSAHRACFCGRPATWVKWTRDDHGYFCDRHWALWRQRFEANPGRVALRRGSGGPHADAEAAAKD